MVSLSGSVGETNCSQGIALRDRSLFIGGEWGGGGGGGWVIVRGHLKFWVLKKGDPGVIAELWRGGGGLEILIRSMFKMEKLTFSIWYYLKHY